MKTHVTFKSNQFKPYLPDDAQVNPNCYGAELAYWLSQKFAERGIITSYPISEDWGWFIEYLVSDDDFLLCCSNVSGTENEWCVFLDPVTKGFFRRKKPAIEKAMELLLTLETILSECNQITDITWETNQID